MSYVLAIFFDRHNDVPDCPDVEEKGGMLFGLPLWVMKNKKIYCRWSVDMVVENDERIIAFGPYESLEQAQHAFDCVSVNREAILGYRITSSESFRQKFPKPSAMWTDG